jgi:DNA-binding transcriptional regulator YiaG
VSNWKTDRAALSAEIKGLIKRAKLSQHELALALGVSQKAVQNYQNEKNLIGKHTAIARFQKLLNKFPETEERASGESAESAQDSNDLPARLAAKQAELGKSNEEMAAVLGINSSAWVNWKVGRNRPTRKRNLAALDRLFAGNPTVSAPAESKKIQFTEQGLRQLKLEFQVETRRAAVRKALDAAASQTGLSRAALRDGVRIVCSLLADQLEAGEIADVMATLT